MTFSRRWDIKCPWWQLRESGFRPCSWGQWHLFVNVKATVGLLHITKDASLKLYFAGVSNDDSAADLVRGLKVSTIEKMRLKVEVRLGHCRDRDLVILPWDGSRRQISNTFITLLFLS